MATKYLQEDGNNAILYVLQNSLERYTLGHEDLAYHMWSDEHGQYRTIKYMMSDMKQVRGRV